MRILGIDPGLARIGWAVVEREKASVRAFAYDCFETKAKGKTEWRLLQIHNEMVRLIQAYEPDALAIEELFFGTNAKTAFLVGQARGVVLLAAAQKNIPVAIYTPLQVKIAVTGYGRADKQQVGRMVKTLLKLSEIPKPDDTADALAVALTHTFSRKDGA